MKQRNVRPRSGSSFDRAAVENLLALMELREAIGRAAFASEKQNDPISPGDGFIAEREIVYWEDPAGGGHASVEALLSALSAQGSGAAEILCACDPSLGKAGRHHDDTAIVIAARDRKSGIVYVLDADIRRRKPDEIMAAIIEWHRVRQFTRVGIEEVQFQEFLKTELERRMQRELPRPPRVEGLKQTSDKLGRIQSLQPIITGGTLRFSRRHRALIDQLLQFPKGDHDDGPDALEMVVRMARTPMARMGFFGRGA